MQSYILPYVIDHAQLVYCRYFQSALIRAVRYCSNVYDFDQESLYIELTFIANGFPLHVIERYLRKFFIKFKTPYVEYILDQSVYNTLRRELFLLMNQQQALLEKNQQLENNKSFFRLYYLYELSPRRQFNKQFQELWSHYTNDYPMLSENLSKTGLNTKRLHSLNALLAREKPTGSISKTTKIYL